MIISKTFEPISKKLNPLYEKHRYKVYHGGRGSAKSWGFAEAIIYYLTNYSIRVLCCREIQKSIMDSSYQLLVDTIQRYGLEELFDITKTNFQEVSLKALVVKILNVKALFFPTVQVHIA